MSNILFCSPKYIKDRSPLNANLADKIVISAIAQAQSDIERSIGSTLYRKIKNDISANTVSGIYKIILDTYIQPTLKFYAIAELIPMNSQKINNKGSNEMGS